MQIKKKIDIEEILDNFTSFAQWDAFGDKYYFIFPDSKRGGKWTLMNYGNVRFSVHGAGEDYMDTEESFFGDRNSIVSFLWEHRSAFNAAIKQSSNLLNESV